MERAEKGRTKDKSDEELTRELMEDPSKIRQVFEMADAVAVYCVIEPELLPAPPDDEPRDPDKLYVDEVDMDDKMYIMSVALGGAKDLEKFRSESLANVDSVRSGQGVAGSPKRPSRARSR